METKNYYGTGILQARNKRKMSQKKLAAHCKMSQQNFSKIERDERKISEKLLSKIADEVKMPVEEIKGLVGNVEQHNHQQQGGTAEVKVQQCLEQLLQMLQAQLKQTLDDNSFLRGRIVFLEGLIREKTA